MSLQTFLEPTHLLQTLALALSIFNLVAFLWLTITVWLNGDRRTWISYLGVFGLGLSALFFFLHAIIISSPPSYRALDFLWHLTWLPAIGVPYIWFAIGLYYAALINVKWKNRRPRMLIIGGVLGSIVFVLLLFNQSTSTFIGTLRLLTYDDPFVGSSTELFSAPVLLPFVFLFYVTFCAIGPWFTFSRLSRLLSVIGAHFVVPKSKQSEAEPVPTLRRALVDAFWDDLADAELLEEPILSWCLARPVLLLAALLMVGLTTGLGILMIWSLVGWLKLAQHPPLPAPPPLNVLPLNLIILDVFAVGAVAFIILLMGYSIVRHGILIERPLARRGFFEQWRGIVIVATTVAIFIALLVDFTHSNLVGLLLITSLATGVYALFTWSSYTAHDRYIALLGPFIRSTSLRHWLNTDLEKTGRGLEDLFFHLCQDVLAVRCARLSIMAGPLRRNFSYRWPDAGASLKPSAASEGEMRLVGKTLHPRALSVDAHRMRMTLDGQPMICWVLPIYDERGLVATLYLGPRQDGAAFTDEDMDLAHACGQRILDTLGDHEAMQAVAGLLRRRTLDVKLLGAQQRRVLHDEILPQMHLSLLHLETLRGRSVSPADKSAMGTKELIRAPQAPLRPLPDTEQVLDEAITMISDAHRRLAAMMRATAPSAPYRLEREGLMHAIRMMLEQDFQNAFDEVKWCVSEETATCIDEVTPPAVAEIILAAVQEALRNAARHARGTDIHRRLCLTLKASCSPHLEVIVADDGVGIVSASASTTGTGGGLLTHSALLAIVGGSLTVKSTPGEGVTVRVLLPAESLR